MLRQFTAACFVLQNDKVLLIYHKKFKKWLPPGGHVDPNEIPSEAAKREVLEETGLKVELFDQENITISTHCARSFPRPYLCLLEDVPAFGDQPEHQHIDFIYLGYPTGGKELVNLEETEGLKWFSKDEILELESDVDIFPDTQETLRHILDSIFVNSL